MKKTKVTARNFLNGLREHGNVSKAAKAAGVTRQAVYKWRDSDEYFRRAWDNAIGEYIDNFEEEIIERARAGPEYDAIDGEGKIVTLRGRPSDALAKFILQSRRYSPTSEHNINVTVSGKNLAKLTDAQLAKIAASETPLGLPEHVEEAEYDEDLEELTEAAADIVNRQSHRR
jgi:hypothetical protein